jgi:DNA-binding CsgD family transcriptional regulator
MRMNTERLTVILILIMAGGLLALDVYDDLSHGSTFGHILEEAIIVSLCVGGVLFLASRLFASKRENIKINRMIEQVRGDLESYKKETMLLSQGLRSKIDGQLNKWQLTPSEKDIARLILKGLSIKEIADIRQAAEKTVSQQLSAIYSKSNLNGRAEFSAFFLEDLLLPD